MRQLKFNIFLLVVLVVMVAFSFLASGVAFAQVPPSGDEDNIVVVSSPPNGDNSNVGGTVVTPPDGSNSNVGGTVVTPHNGDNSNVGGTSGSVTPPVIPNLQPSSGGGGSVISYSITPCFDVTYGDWGAPANGYQYRDVINQNPQNCKLTAAQEAARSKKYPPADSQVLGVKAYPDGSLLRGPDWKIYIIVNGKRQFVENWGKLCGQYKGQKIIDVSQEILAQYQEVLGVKAYPDGSLLRGADKKIYLIVDGGKKRIKSLKELFNYKGRKINSVSYEILAQYPEVLGGKVCGQASLLRGLDKKIYLIIDDKRKLIKNLQELINYRGREIVDIDNKTLASQPLI